MQGRVGERDTIPWIIPTIKHGGGFVMVCILGVGFYPLQSQGFAQGEGQIESNQLLQYMTSNDPTWNVVGGSRICTCKIMTQSILLYSARGILNTKRNSMSFNWCLGLCNQWGINFTEKSELNNPQVWLTSGNSCRKAGMNYYNLPPVIGEKNVENLWSSDRSQRGSFWCIKSLRSFLV